MLSRPGFSRLVFSAAAAAALFVQPLDSARVAAIPVVRAVSATAAPGDFDGDGRMDVAVKHDNGEWVIDFAANGLGFWDDLLPGYGGAEYVPARLITTAMAEPIYR